jgi:nucleoside-diphosphate-sugar epimerase
VRETLLFRGSLGESVAQRPTILITGATGFLGGAALLHLVRHHSSCRLLVLVRGDSPHRRLWNRLARFGQSSIDGVGNLEILRGDLTDPAALEDPRLDFVTHVLHLAANTSFRSVRSVRRTNIDGTLNLGRRMERVAGLVRFLYVGTAYICGTDPAPVVHEDDYPRDGVEHVAEYTRSKAECERQLERLALPLVVARPSVVVGHTDLGCLPSASIFWYYRTVDLLGRVASPPNRRKDIVPVDYVASALVFLLLRPQLQQRRYHISAGEASSVTWAEMAEAFARSEGRKTNAYTVIDFATLQSERGRLHELLGPGDDDRLLDILEMFWRFSASSVEVFDNSRLLAEGMPAPPPFTSYLHRCLTLPAKRSVHELMNDDC